MRPGRAERTAIFPYAVSCECLRSVAAAIDGCVNEQLTQLVIVAGKAVGHGVDLADVSRGVGCSQAHGAEHFLRLATGEGATVGQFLAQALGAATGAAACAPT